MRNCQTCDEPMPGADPRRKFCSGKCRKAQYATPCARCGGPTSGSEGRRTDALCIPCGQEHVAEVNREQARELRDQVIALWAAGKTMREVAEAVGWKYTAIRPFINRMRRQGEPLPYRRRWTPDSLASQSVRTTEANARRWRAAA